MANSKKPSSKAIIQVMADAMADAMDQFLIEDFLEDKYELRNEWTTRKGVRLRKFVVSISVLAWLEEEHSQFNIKDPSWWKYDNKIIMKDDIYLLMLLKYGK